MYSLPDDVILMLFQACLASDQVLLVNCALVCRRFCTILFSSPSLCRMLAFNPSKRSVVGAHKWNRLVGDLSTLDRALQVTKNVELDITLMFSSYDLDPLSSARYFQKVVEKVHLRARSISVVIANSAPVHLEAIVFQHAFGQLTFPALSVAVVRSPILDMLPHLIRSLANAKVRLDRMELYSSRQGNDLFVLEDQASHLFRVPTEHLTIKGEGHVLDDDSLGHLSRGLVSAEFTRVSLKTAHLLVNLVHLVLDLAGTTSLCQLDMPNVRTLQIKEVHQSQSPGERGSLKWPSLEGLDISFSDCKWTPYVDAKRLVSLSISMYGSDQSILVEWIGALGPTCRHLRLCVPEIDLATVHRIFTRSVVLESLEIDGVVLPTSPFYSAAWLSATNIPIGFLPKLKVLRFLGSRARVCPVSLDDMVRARLVSVHYPFLEEVTVAGVSLFKFLTRRVE